MILEQPPPLPLRLLMLVYNQTIVHMEIVRRCFTSKVTLTDAGIPRRRYGCFFLLLWYRSCSHQLVPNSAGIFLRLSDPATLVNCCDLSEIQRECTYRYTSTSTACRPRPVPLSHFWPLLGALGLVHAAIAQHTDSYTSVG